LDSSVIIVEFIIALLAGILGALLGVGGGFIMVPAMTIILDIPIHYAIAASFVGILMNSTSASIIYLRNRMPNIRIANVMQIAAIIGAFIGASLSISLDKTTLSLIYSFALIFTALMMYRKDTKKEKVEEIKSKEKFIITSSYIEQLSKKRIIYKIYNIKLGLIFTLIVGVYSGLLGVGGGILSVPIMNKIMKIPIKPAIATSSIIMGTTAIVGLLVFAAEGNLLNSIAIPIGMGIFFGAQIGSRLNQRIEPKRLKNIFVILIIFIAIQMIINTLSGI
tara:strand:+ start:293 stop:1126 length:834 start_codon:yes stop_codon:yes gene_type:complete